MTIRIFLIFILFSLVGCSSNPVIQNKTYVATPGDNLLLACNVTPPPNKEEFINATDADRVTLLSGYSSDLLKDLSLCNNALTVLRAWKVDVKKLSNTDVNKLNDLSNTDLNIFKSLVK